MEHVDPYLISHSEVGVYLCSSLGRVQRVPIVKGAHMRQPSSPSPVPGRDASTEWSRVETRENEESITRIPRSEDKKVRLFFISPKTLQSLPVLTD